MGFNIRRPERRVRLHRLGLILLVIMCASPSKIMAKGDRSLATNDVIEGEAERAGVATVSQWSTHATSSRIVLEALACAC